MLAELVVILVEVLMALGLAWAGVDSGGIGAWVCFTLVGIIVADVALQLWPFIYETWRIVATYRWRLLFFDYVHSWSDPLAQRGTPKAWWGWAVRRLRWLRGVPR